MDKSKRSMRIDSTKHSLRWRTRPAGQSWPGWLEGEASVNDLAAPFDLTLPAISKHIKVLEHAGLDDPWAHERSTGRARLDTTPLAARGRDWTDYYRPIWEARFDRHGRTTSGQSKTPKTPKR